MRCRIKNWPALLVAALLADCSSAGQPQPREDISPAVLYAFREETAGGEYQILDYQGKNRGLPAPWWAEPYLRGGTAAVETLSEGNKDARDFAGKYIFISLQKSSNLSAILQWKNFQTKPDFSTMIFPRIYRRIIRGISASPEQYYGAFFPAVLKTMADADWNEAALADSLWLIIRLPTQDMAESGVTNIVLSLAVIDKQIFERKVNQLLDHIKIDGKLNREQRSAVKRLKSNFFDNF
ncbi:MAG: hypothetical protein LBG74_07090 [Spirochaetaceae bacterium]|jgi:hypothetical protein|nr:hypothetical protein [Spirochaetaceae bacterium]